MGASGECYCWITLNNMAENLFGLKNNFYRFSECFFQPVQSNSFPSKFTFIPHYRTIAFSVPGKLSVLDFHCSWCSTDTVAYQPQRLPITDAFIFSWRGITLVCGKCHYVKKKTRLRRERRELMEARLEVTYKTRECLNVKCTSTLD